MNLEPKIDKTDRQILNELAEDARIDLKGLAKQCGLTSSAVLKRVRKLKASGIIVGTYLELKRGTLGYPQEATIGITAETSRIDEIARKIRAIPNVMVCAKSVGRYNLFSHVFAKDLLELDRVTHSIKSINGVKSTSINIHIDEPTGSGDEKESEKRTVDSSTRKPYRVDETDLKIIYQLVDDAQMPFLKIAKKIGISPETVRQRYEKMNKEGILRCRTLIDGTKIGCQGTAFFLISCHQGPSSQSTADALRDMQVFIKNDKVIGGGFEIFAAAPIKDIRDLGRLTDTIERIPTVENVEVGVLMFTYYSFVPKPGFPYKCDTVELS